MYIQQMLNLLEELNHSGPNITTCDDGDLSWEILVIDENDITTHIQYTSLFATTLIVGSLRASLFDFFNLGTKVINPELKFRLSTVAYLSNIIFYIMSPIHYLLETFLVPTLFIQRL